MIANERQVGGEHYKKKAIQHWDYAASNNFDYFQGQITKYVSRWKDKNGLQDLEKAMHFLEKYIEDEKAKLVKEPVDQIEKRRGRATRIDHPSPFGFNAEEELSAPAVRGRTKHPLANVLETYVRDDD